MACRAPLLNNLKFNIDDSFKLGPNEAGLDLKVYNNEGYIKEISLIFFLILQWMKIYNWSMLRK